MSIRAYRGYGTLATPQSEAIPGSDQIANFAGGFSFPVTDWTQLERFLVLGSASGTYYVNAAALTKDNAQCVERCLKIDGYRVVKTITEISQSGRAPKNEPALFALAMAISLGDPQTRAAAAAAVPYVVRTGTHLLHWVSYCESFRGWGRLLRKAVAQWYLSKDVSALAYQLVKYQSRDKWTQRDLLRLSHPHPAHGKQGMTELLKWAVKGAEAAPREADELPELRLVYAFEQAKKATDAKQVARLIRDYRLPREGVPTEYLTDKNVWAALLETDMPYTAMIRNLANMTRVGLLEDFGRATSDVCARLSNTEAMQKARVHPLHLLAALKTYAQGHGERGKNTWTPVRRIVDALDAAFYVSFKNVEPTNKRMMIGLDVSGSMHGSIVNGMAGMTCHETQAAMALITANAEPNYAVCAFDTNTYAPAISPRQRLDDVIKSVSKLGGGGTDCALPILLATEKRIPIDVFAIYTDNETWAGAIHPAQAMEKYRKAMGIPAKLAVIAMASTSHSIASNTDGGMLDLCGMDTNAPALLSDFAGH